MIERAFEIQSAATTTPPPESATGWHAFFRLFSFPAAIALDISGIAIGLPVMAWMWIVAGSSAYAAVVEANSVELIPVGLFSVGVLLPWLLSLWWRRRTQPPAEWRQEVIYLAFIGAAWTALAFYLIAYLPSEYQVDIREMTALGREIEGFILVKIFGYVLFYTIVSMACAVLLGLLSYLRGRSADPTVLALIGALCALGVFLLFGVIDIAHPAELAALALGYTENAVTPYVQYLSLAPVPYYLATLFPRPRHQ